MLFGRAMSESDQRVRIGAALLWITSLTVLCGAGACSRFVDSSLPAALLSAVAAVAAVPLLLYWPGRIVLDLLGMGAHSGAAWRVLISAALSLGACPLLLEGLWRLPHRHWVVLLGWWAVLCGLNVVSRLRRTGESTGPPPPALFEKRGTKAFACVLGLWLAGCMVLTYWPSQRDGCPVAAIPHDYVKHHAILFSLEHQGLPLGNVFCADVAQQPYGYYHYFYLLPATLRLWSGDRIGIGLAFGLFGAAVALTVVGLIYLLAKRLSGGEGPAMLAASAASLVGGLDVIPLALQGRMVVTLDAWADQSFRIHNFYTQMLWCPQHVHGLTVLLLAVVLLSMAPGPGGGSCSAPS